MKVDKILQKVASQQKRQKREDEAKKQEQERERQQRKRKWLDACHLSAHECGCSASASNSNSRAQAVLVEVGEKVIDALQQSLLALAHLYSKLPLTDAPVIFTDLYPHYQYGTITLQVPFTTQMSPFIQ